AWRRRSSFHLESGSACCLLEIYTRPQPVTSVARPVTCDRFGQPLRAKRDGWRAWQVTTTSSARIGSERGSLHGPARIYSMVQSSTSEVSALAEWAELSVTPPGRAVATPRHSWDSSNGCSLRGRISWSSTKDPTIPPHDPKGTRTCASSCAWHPS